MDISVQTQRAILAFFVVIGPLIFFHELGHFLAARWNKIKVEEFGIGLPPRMLTLFQQGGTRFTLNWLPLGGFMRPAGEDDPSVAEGLAGASKMARLEVLAAGPFANIVVAFLLLVVMFMIGAPDVQPGAKVQLVEAGSPAAAGGLQVGDIILKVDNTTVDQSDTLTNFIYSHKGQPILVTFQRGSATQTTTITPRVNPPDGQGPTGIQIQEITVLKRYDLFSSIGMASNQFADFFVKFAQVPSMVMNNQVAARNLRPLSFVGISQVGGEYITTSVEQNALWPIIQLTAYISLALALTNLLPIPALDGGRILFVIIEAVRGRRVDPRRETMVHLVGFAMLLAAMLVFVYLDITDPLIK